MLLTSVRRDGVLERDVTLLVEHPVFTMCSQEIDSSFFFKGNGQDSAVLVRLDVC
jgi:hypothetical protein